MARHPLAVDDLWTLPRVGAPVPSPDGSRVVVPVTRFDMEKNLGNGRLWLVPAGARGAGDGRKGDPARALTAPDVSSGQPAWSPDGDRLVFVRKHEDHGQLHLLPLDGGEAERLTDLPLGVVDPRWFPDGRRVAFLSEVYADEPDLEATRARAEAEAKEPMKAAVTEDRWFRLWDRWITDGRVHHLFVIDLESREVMDLTPDSRRIVDPVEPADRYRISPDGREIAFTAVRTEPPYDRILDGVFTVRVPARVRAGGKAGAIRCLTPRHPAGASGAEYSPDGRYLIYGMRTEWDFYADRTRLVAYDRKARSHHVLTESWDRSAQGWTFADDGRTLLLEAEVEARVALFRLDVPAAIADPTATEPVEIHRGGWLTSPRPAGGRIFLNRSTLSEPPEVVSMDADGSGLVRLTAFTKPGMSEVALGRVEEEVFEGADGDPVQMWVLYPPGDPRPTAGARRSRSRPLVHMIHGGPHGAFGDQWHWRWNAQAFAAPGYAVAVVNFHGSTGFGQEFAASILGGWGDKPYRDVMAATDLLVKRGVANRNRLAVTGGSYGGYLVSWIASQTDRFACIVNHAGVSDFQTQFASDITHGRVRSMGGSPWEDREGLDRYNPMRHADGFRSPMLVLHGEKDYRVPYAQGLEIYAVYKAKELSARLVVYPDENHWILKPRNSRHWYGEVLGWLARHLKGKR